MLAERLIDDHAAMHVCRWIYRQRSKGHEVQGISLLLASWKLMEGEGECASHSCCNPMAPLDPGARRIWF